MSRQWLLLLQKYHISWKYLEKYIEPSDCEKTVVSENHFDLNYWYFISNGGTGTPQLSVITYKVCLQTVDSDWECEIKTTSVNQNPD